MGTPYLPWYFRRKLSVLLFEEPYVVCKFSVSSRGALGLISLWDFIQKKSVVFDSDWVCTRLRSSSTLKSQQFWAFKERNKNSEGNAHGENQEMHVDKWGTLRIK